MNHPAIACGSFTEPGRQATAVRSRSLCSVYLSFFKQGFALAKNKSQGRNSFLHIKVPYLEGQTRSRQVFFLHLHWSVGLLAPCLTLEATQRKSTLTLRIMLARAPAGGQEMRGRAKSFEPPRFASLHCRIT